MNIKKIIYALISLALFTSCVVPDNAYLMDLNRRGKWKQAASIGRDMLENKDKFSFSETAETYFQVSYALVRLRDIPAASRYLHEYENWREGGILEPERIWLDKEIFLLKEETGLLDEIQSTLLAAMNANGAKEYAKAVELALSTLEMSGINDIQIAYGYFLASVCSFRQGKTDDALKYLEYYNRYRNSLPPDELLRIEEIQLYRDLNLELPADQK